MKIYITGSGGSVDVSQYVTSATLSGDYKQCARSLKFGLASNANDQNLDVVDCDLGNGVVMEESGKEIFNGFILSRTRQTGDNEIDITAYDRGIYLKRNKAVYNVNTTPEAQAKRICTDFGISAGDIAKTGVTVKRKFIGTALSEILFSMYTKASEKNGKKYIIRFEGSRLAIRERSDSVAGELDGTFNLNSAVITESAENMVNCVVLYDKNGNYKSTYRDNDLIKRFGLMQSYIKDSDGTGADEAKKALSEGKVERKITVNNIGDVNFITGNAVTVKEPYTGLKGIFQIDSDSHTWKGGLYSNKLTLNFEKIMNESSAGSEEK